MAEHESRRVIVTVLIAQNECHHCHHDEYALAAQCKEHLR